MWNAATAESIWFCAPRCECKQVHALQSTGKDSISHLFVALIATAHTHTHRLCALLMGGTLTDRDNRPYSMPSSVHGGDSPPSPPRRPDQTSGLLFDSSVALFAPKLTTSVPQMPLYWLGSHCVCQTKTRISLAPNCDFKGN